MTQESERNKENNEIFRNRLLAEYTRQELEEEFIRCNEELDDKAKSLLDLEKQAQYLSGRLDRVDQDRADQTKQQVCFNGSQAPIAFRQTQLTVKELQDQIDILQGELAQQQLKRDKVLQEVRYFRSLLNFPGKKSKAGTPSNGKRKSREVLIRKLTELIAHEVPEQIEYRVRAAISILNDNLLEAKDPMRDLLNSLGERLPLFDMLDKQRKIEELEQRIQELTEKLERLRARHQEMVKKHTENLDRFKQEAKENNEKYKELMDLQQEKEQKEAEAAKVDELRIIEEGLRKEIALLEDQIRKIREENDERVKRLQEQMEQAIKDLTKQLKDLDQHCQNFRQSNREIEDTLASLQRNYEVAIDRQSKIREETQNLKAEYQSLTRSYGYLLSSIDDDPFESPNFIEFLSQMSSKDWKFKTIKQFQDEITSCNARAEKFKRKIDEYKEKENSFKQKIEDENKNIASLEDQLQNLKADHDGLLSMLEVQPEMNTIDEAPHFTVQPTIRLNDGEVAIMIYFANLESINMVSVGPKKAKLMFAVDFHDFEPLCSREFEPVEGASIESKLCFTPENNHYLVETLKSYTLKVQLFKIVGFEQTMLGEGNLSLRSFLNKKYQWSGLLEIKSIDSDSVIATVNYEVALYGTLLDFT